MPLPRLKATLWPAVSITLGWIKKAVPEGCMNLRIGLR